jgi:hypothetical protein
LHRCRVDPQHCSLGQFFQDEIASPLKLDFYIRLPESIPTSRLAVLEQANLLKALVSLPFPLMLAAMNPRSAIYRALVVNPGDRLPLDKGRVYVRNLEVPSGGGVGTACAIARAYSVFATGGWELGLRQETLQALSAPAIPPEHGFYDEALKGEIQFSLGFMKTARTGLSVIPARPARVVPLALPTRRSAWHTPISPIAWGE